MWLFFDKRVRHLHTLKPTTRVLLISTSLIKPPTEYSTHTHIQINKYSTHIPTFKSLPHSYSTSSTISSPLPTLFFFRYYFYRLFPIICSLILGVILINWLHIFVNERMQHILFLRLLFVLAFDSLNTLYYFARWYNKRWHFTLIGLSGNTNEIAYIEMEYRVLWEL